MWARVTCPYQSKWIRREGEGEVEDLVETGINWENLVLEEREENVKHEMMGEILWEDYLSLETGRKEVRMARNWDGYVQVIFDSIFSMK